MEIPQRQSVKVLLLNPKNQLLLMHVDDPKTRSSDGKYHGSFWAPIGGGIKFPETAQQAAVREVFEETGIQLKDRELGPMVWYGEFDLILDAKMTHIKQFYFVARTKQTETSLSNLTQSEKKTVKKLHWFSLKELQESDEVFFPVVLLDFLPDILAGKYPKEPLELDLTLQPKKTAKK
jgi:8-oxo-dGTP pyrophosphatase MutT (NUDIX family)